MPFRTRRAERSDLDDVVALCGRYAARSGYEHAPFDPAIATRCLADLLDDDRLGILWVASPTRSTGAVGYLLLTWGYSLESGGRDGLIDEVYVEPRNQGIGSALVDAALEECRRRGVRRVFLETEAVNEGARRLYGRKGFVAEDSIWMCRWSDAGPVS